MGPQTVQVIVPRVNDPLFRANGSPSHLREEFMVALEIAGLPVEECLDPSQFILFNSSTRQPIADDGSPPKSLINWTLTSFIAPFAADLPVATPFFIPPSPDDVSFVALLYHVGQLVSEQLLSMRTAGVVFAFPEENVLSGGKGSRLQRVAEPVGLGIGVDAHPAKVGPERPPH
jgi:hypothetical protein